MKSGISAMLKAFAPAAHPLPADLPYDASLKPEKQGYPPSKCYGAEPSCHSDSW
jgi:hypothetical protein